MKQVDGSCVKITRERAVVTKKVKKKKGKEVYVAPTQCGAESKIKLTVVKRDERKVTRGAAGVRGGRARRSSKVSGKDDGARGARYYFALGKVAEADVEFEKYLDDQVPGEPELR